MLHGDMSYLSCPLFACHVNIEKKKMKKKEMGFWWKKMHVASTYVLAISVPFAWLKERFFTIPTWCDASDGVWHCI